MAYKLADYLIFIILGVLPALIWLCYFLEKDKEPEPKLMILVVFLMGILGAKVAATIQEPIRNLIYSMDPVTLTEMKMIGIVLTDAFFVVALLEESVKFIPLLFLLAFGIKELDEPVDFIIYAITAGLGFAALENYFYFSVAPTGQIAELVFLRFAITTLFHAMAAGIMGYFLILAIRRMKKSLIPLGLMVVAFLHTLYNILIDLMIQSEEIIYPCALLVFLFLLTLLLLKGFSKAKAMKSICQISSSCR